MKIDLSHARQVLPPTILAEYDIEKPLERARLKTTLLWLVREIIDELPDTQQTFFRDYFEGGMNQSQVAKMYHVTPQAITNRLYKLKNTVRKKLEDDYGLTREIVITILNFRDYNQYMLDELRRTDDDESTTAKVHKDSPGTNNNENMDETADANTDKTEIDNTDTIVVYAPAV